MHRVLQKSLPQLKSQSAWQSRDWPYCFHGYRSSKGFPWALTFHLADAQDDTKNPPKFWVRSRHQYWASAENTVHLKSRQLWFGLCFQLQKPWQGDPARAEHQAPWQGLLDTLNRADIQGTQAGGPDLSPVTRHTELKGMGRAMQWNIRGKPCLLLRYRTGIYSPHETPHRTTVTVLRAKSNHSLYPGQHQCSWLNLPLIL